MKKFIAGLLFILTIVFSYLTYKVATKEIFRDGFYVESGVYSKGYTTFNHKLSDEQRLIYDLMGSISEDYSYSDRRQKELDIKAYKYQIITFLFAFGSILCLYFSSRLAFFKKTQKESIISPTINNLE